MQIIQNIDDEDYEEEHTTTCDNFHRMVNAENWDREGYEMVVVKRVKLL